MPWRGVTVSEQRQRFLDDYELNYYSVTDLAECFGTSRTTAYTPPGHQGKWINRFMKHGPVRLSPAFSPASPWPSLPGPQLAAASPHSEVGTWRENSFHLDRFATC